MNHDYDDDDERYEYEFFTVGCYDVNGKPFTVEVDDDGLVELNAEAAEFGHRWVKVTHVIGQTMYYFKKPISMSMTRIFGHR